MTYQQNANIAALARLCSTYESCIGFHELTRKIVRERNDLNTKLSSYYSQFTGCCIPAVSGRIGNIGCLDGCEYVNALIVKLEQSKAAADLAIARACRPELRHQAKTISRASKNEASALRRWQQTGNTAYATQWQPLSEYCGVSRPTPCNDGCSMFTP
jgi:hypothetical protein